MIYVRLITVIISDPSRPENHHTMSYTVLLRNRTHLQPSEWTFESQTVLVTRLGWTFVFPWNHLCTHDQLAELPQEDFPVWICTLASNFRLMKTFGCVWHMTHAWKHFYPQLENTYRFIFTFLQSWEFLLVFFFLQVKRFWGPNWLKLMQWNSPQMEQPKNITPRVDLFLFFFHLNQE